MYNEIKFIFSQMGYEPIKLNVEEPHVNIKLVKKETDNSTEGYVIVTLDETSGIKYTMEQSRNISLQIRNFLMQKDCYLYHFLYVFISNNNTPPFNPEDTDGCFWYIMPGQAKPAIYGNMLPMYEGLKRPIEEYLASVTHNPDGNCRQYNNNQQLNTCFTAANVSIIIINVIIFILTDFFSLPTSEIQLIDTGSLSWDMVINHHQYYRVITSMFLHIGPSHIFNNMLVLLFIGSYVEQYLGKARYLIIYFLSGIIAGCTSMVYNIMQYSYTESVGASGAVFGIIGSLLCILVVRQHQSHDLDFRRVLFMAFIILYGGFTSQGIDNAAHIGGFAGGIAVTLVILSINSNFKRKAGTN